MERANAQQTPVQQMPPVMLPAMEVIARERVIKGTTGSLLFRGVINVIGWAIFT